MSKKFTKLLPFVVLACCCLFMAATTMVDLSYQVMNVLPLANGGGRIIESFCNGAVGTGNGTTYIFGMFNNVMGSASAVGGCNDGVSGVQEIPMPVACTAQNLYVSANAAGANSGSGVTTIYKNGSSTALSCTLGTGTSCHLTGTTVSFNAGDTYSVRVTTGAASDTTSSIKTAFVCQ